MTPPRRRLRLAGSLRDILDDYPIVQIAMVPQSCFWGIDSVIIGWLQLIRSFEPVLLSVAGKFKLAAELGATNLKLASLASSLETQADTVSLHSSS